MADPLLTVTGNGIAATAVTASPAANTLSSLAFDGSVSRIDDSSDVEFSAPFAETQSIILTSVSPTSAPTTSPSSSNTSNNDEISMGTVIGACVGAFAGAAILILIGIWLYKRSAPKSARGPTKDRSWNKLEEGRDQWEGQDQTKEAADTVAPMEKLTMFKKSSPSVRTAYTHKTESDAPHLTFDLDPHPFSQYHPNLAQEMASSEDITAASVKPPFARAGIDSTISWDSEAANPSFASLRSGHVSGAMSPVIPMAIPTPSITSSEPHRWESAEIVDFDGQTAEVVDPGAAKESQNPFLSPIERRPSISNPFFGANSSLRHVPKSAKAKGKERAVIAEDEDPVNPFNGKPKNLFQDEANRTHHPAVASIDSVASNERAIQSLLAALDDHVSADDVQERLRVASMQPSFNSEVSSYSTELSKEFPLPPNVRS